jgi:hypothetical protein
VFDFNVLTGVISASAAIIAIVVLADCVFNVGRR